MSNRAKILRQIENDKRRIRIKAHEMRLAINADDWDLVDEQASAIAALSSDMKVSRIQLLDTSWEDEFVSV